MASEANVTVTPFREISGNQLETLQQADPSVYYKMFTGRTKIDFGSIPASTFRYWIARIVEHLDEQATGLYHIETDVQSNRATSFIVIWAENPADIVGLKLAFHGKEPRGGYRR